MPPAEIARRVRLASEAVEHSHAIADSRFKLYDDAQIAQLPQPAWLIHGVLPSNALAVLIAAPKSFKSFLALDWACHIALGSDWCGRPVRQGSVVFVYAEGAPGIQQRLAAWKKYTGRQDSLPIWFLPRRVSVDVGTEASELLAEIESTVRPAPVLIVVDTVARNMEGNENATPDMSAFVRGCDVLREGTGAAVLLVHHEGLSAEGRGRGSSALEAAADTVILCSREQDRLRVSCKWMKDAPEFDPLAMEAMPVAPSLVLRPSGASRELTGQRLHCLRVLHENFAAKDGAAYTQWVEAAGIASSSFNKARDSLRTDGYVTAEGGKWIVTDSGRLALDSSASSRSISAPLLQDGAEIPSSTSTRGYALPPVVEENRNSALTGPRPESMPPAILGDMGDVPASTTAAEPVQIAAAAP